MISPNIGMLWLAKIGDDSITEEGEEYSGENVFNHLPPHINQERNHPLVLLVHPQHPQSNTQDVGRVGNNQERP
jgi:hypothetical protein